MYLELSKNKWQLKRLVLVLSVVLTGCVQNNIKLIPNGASVEHGRAIVLYGVRVDDNLIWPFPEIGVSLDQYNTKEHTAGNCWVYNRMDATVQSKPGATTYFAFDALPGVYVYSIFNGVHLVDDLGTNALAFVVPPDRVTYIGDFVLKNTKTKVQRDLGAFTKALGKSLPNLRGEIFLAEELTVENPKPFLCTP